MEGGECDVGVGVVVAQSDSAVGGYPGVLFEPSGDAWGMMAEPSAVMLRDAHFQRRARAGLWSRCLTFFTSRPNDPTVSDPCRRSDRINPGTLTARRVLAHVPGDLSCSPEGRLVDF